MTLKQENEKLRELVDLLKRMLLARPSEITSFFNELRSLESELSSLSSQGEGGEDETIYNAQYVANVLRSAEFEIEQHYKEKGITRGNTLDKIRILREYIDEMGLPVPVEPSKNELRSQIMLLLYQGMPIGDADDVIRLIDRLAQSAPAVREELIKCLDWITREDSPYAIAYGDNPRFATTNKDLTTEELVDEYLQKDKK